MMRLLHVDTFRLEEFVGDQATPRYAILSHTWEEGEVLYLDLFHLDKTRGKKGFNKIQRCCEQAKNDGLEWVWVDTCCIDKTSSAELSEAINSMYSWYQDAMVCYAYLGDVETRDSLLDCLDHMRKARLGRQGEESTSLFSPDSLISVKSDLSAGTSFGQGCRWFSRGWTLQELIAPAWVKFYSASWKYLGNKSDWETPIEAATGIDAAILNHTQPLASIPAARKMYLAGRRNTTRIEDGAYSLLGIFGVNMPLLYGEGEKAFLRLQEHILRTTDDHTLFMFGKLSPLLPNVNQWVAPQAPLPFRGPIDFDTDRGLHSILSPSSGNPRFIMAEGSGGIGLRIELPLKSGGFANLRRPKMESAEADEEPDLTISLAAFNVWADLETMRDAVAYSVVDDAFYNITDVNEKFRVALLVGHADDNSQTSDVGMVKKIYRLNKYVIVRDAEARNWEVSHCYFVSRQPRGVGGVTKWIDWQPLEKGQRLGMGYTVKHVERNFLPGTTKGRRLQCIWILECGGMPDIFAYCEVRLSLPAKDLSFIVTTEKWPENSFTMQSLDQWQATRAKALKGSPEISPSVVDGLKYEHRYHVNESLDVVWYVVRRKSILYGTLTVDTAWDGDR